MEEKLKVHAARKNDALEAALLVSPLNLNLATVPNLAHLVTANSKRTS